MRRNHLSIAGLLLAGSFALASALSAQASVTADLSPKAKAQIDSVRRAVAQFANPQTAEDAGYETVFGLVPLQGVHYVRPDLVRDGTFDLTKPPVLMYAPVNGEPKLVGVAYAYEHP